MCGMSGRGTGQRQNVFRFVSSAKRQSSCKNERNHKKNLQNLLFESCFLWSLGKWFSVVGSQLFKSTFLDLLEKMCLFENIFVPRAFTQYSNKCTLSNPFGEVKTFRMLFCALHQGVVRSSEGPQNDFAFYTAYIRERCFPRHFDVLRSNAKH